MVLKEGDRAIIVGSGYIGFGALASASTRGKGQKASLALRRFIDDEAGGVASESYSVDFDNLERIESLDSFRTITTKSDAGRVSWRGAATIIAFDEVLLPYRFGFHSYDPFESLPESMEQAAIGLAPALWAAMEGDLFGFAFDEDFTAELERSHGTDEWRRFASLNDLYRSAIKAIAPLGIAPPEWTAWLRDSRPLSARRPPLARAFERLATRPVDAIAAVVAGRAAESGGLFIVRL